VVLLFVNNAPFHAILVNSVPPAIRASAVAMNIVVIHAGGDLISRFGVGKLSDSIAEGNANLIGAFARMLGIDPVREHLTAALLVVPAGLLVSAFFFFWGARKYSGVAVDSRSWPFGLRFCMPSFGDRLIRRWSIGHTPNRISEAHLILAYQMLPHVP